MLIIVALRVTFVTLVLTGLAYPLAVTGLRRLCFTPRPTAAWWSRAGKVVGLRAHSARRFDQPRLLSAAAFGGR